MPRLPGARSPGGHGSNRPSRSAALLADRPPHRPVASVVLRRLPSRRAYKIRPMALTPGGGRSPSTKPRPDKARLDKGSSTPPRPPRAGGAARWTRSASVAVLRFGLLMGGLVIILDLFFMLLTQHSVSADDIATFDLMDLFLNVVLFSVLGVLVVR